MNIKLTKHCIFASVGEQKLYLFTGGALAAEMPISTSRNPPSCAEGSLGTPHGLHKIDGKIGDGEPMDTVFRGRVPCGRLGEQTPGEREKNLILGRIMRLRGLEDGVNSGTGPDGRCVDTYARYVYIHGTNQEHALGTPNSHGCLLVGAGDLLRLFGEVPDGSIVFIEK